MGPIHNLRHFYKALFRKGVLSSADKYAGDEWRISQTATTPKNSNAANAYELLPSLPLAGARHDIWYSVCGRFHM